MSNRPLQDRILTVDDFSGGITDNFLGNQDVSKYKEADNLIINEHRKPVTRSGSEIMNFTSPRVSSGKRIHNVMKVRGNVYQHSEKSIWYDSGSAQTKLFGPDGNEAFPSATDYTQTSFVEYNDQLLITTDDRDEVLKVFEDGNGDKNAVTLGLPRVDLYASFALANGLKASYNTHIADALAHTPSIDSLNIVTAPNAVDFESLVTLIDDFIIKYSAHFSDALLVTPVFHTAGGGEVGALTITASPRNAIDTLTFLEHLALNYNRHDDDGLSHDTPSANQETTPLKPYVTSAIAGTNNYLYGFYYEYEYTVDDETFLERGPVTIIEGTELVDPGTATRRVWNIGAIVNSPTTHFKITDIKVVIGRSQNNGDIIYIVDRVENGTTQWIDNLTDAEIVDNETFYIEGGILDNEMPPKCKFMSVANDVVCYANLKEGNTIQSAKASFSKKFQPYACPDFTLEFSQTITAANSIGIYHIIFSEDRIWRIEGGIDDLGRGQFVKRELPDQVGCISNGSVIPIKEGLLFASSDGIYFTDGFNVYRTSKEFKKRYNELIEKEFIRGCYDQKNNLALFSCRTDLGLDFNDIIYCANLNFRQGEDLCFTTWSGFNVTSLNYIDDQVIRGDKDGYVYIHDLDLKNDLQVDTDTDPSLWVKKPIIYTLITVAWDFGLRHLRKWVSKIELNAENVSSLSLDLSAANDGIELFSALKPVINDTNIEWGDSSITWGSTGLRWDYIASISAWRRFPARSLRCQYKQIKFTNFFRVIDTDEIKGPASIDPVLKEVTLLNGAQSWNLISPGYYISFDTDDFAQRFLIIGRTPTVLTLLDPDGSLDLSASSSWKIEGYKLGETLSMLDYSVFYADMTTTQEQYRAES